MLRLRRFFSVGFFRVTTWQEAAWWLVRNGEPSSGDEEAPAD